VLPVAIEVPRTGTSFQFARALILDEETKVTFSYRADRQVASSLPEGVSNDRAGHGAGRSSDLCSGRNQRSAALRGSSRSTLIKDEIA